MKIIYYSNTFFADCDFPLIHELQKKGHDVRYYLPITSFNKRSTLIDIKDLYPHTGIFPASIYPEFNIYKDEIDLDKLFIVNQRYKQKYHPLNLLLHFKLVLHFILQKADIIHFTLPPTLVMKCIYLVKRKLVLTLHDPFPHSSRINKRSERDRRNAFKRINKIILLNKKQIDEFRTYYKIPSKHIFVSKLGMYNSLNNLTIVPPKTTRPFLLFFGLITAYKGLEYLMQAMVKIHDVHPEIDLVIAGGGEIYFDMEKYENLDYIHIINRYIPSNELAGLLKNCLFSVCPYKDATQSGVVQTAFSLDVPMIVTDVGALPESVIDGQFGLVVPPCDVNALAGAIDQLLTNRHLLESLRKNIQSVWKKQMSWDSIAEEYLKCYMT